MFEKILIANRGEIACRVIFKGIAYPEMIKAAVEIIFPEDKGDRAGLAAREVEYNARFANPFVASVRGYVDDVILPHEMRKPICRSLVMLRDKKLEGFRRRHESISL